MILLMKNKDKSLRKDLEYAYNVASDIGLIAKTFKEQGERGIHRMKVHPGIPIRPQQSERLPTAEEIIENITTTNVTEALTEINETEKIEEEPQKKGYNFAMIITAFIIILIVLISYLKYWRKKK